VPTIKAIDGFEHGVLDFGTTSPTAGARLYSNVVGANAGATIVATGAQRTTGQRCLLCDAVGTARAPGVTYEAAGYYGTTNRLIGKLWFYVDTWGASDNTFHYLSGGPCYFRFVTTGGNKRVGAFLGTLAEVDSGQNLVEDTWYCLDYDLNMSGTTWTCDWKINGVAQTQLSQGSHVATNVTTAEIGLLSNVSGWLARFEDMTWSVTAGDYPLPDYKIVGANPDGVGTHDISSGNAQFSWSDNSGTNWTDIAGATDAAFYSRVDEFPAAGTGGLTDTTWVRQNVGSTIVSNVPTVNFLEYTYGDAGIGTAPVAVRQIAAVRAATTTADNLGLTLGEAGSTHVQSLRGDPSETSFRYWQATHGTKPSGGAWTLAAAQALVARQFSSDVNPTPILAACMIEIAVPNVGQVATSPQLVWNLRGAIPAERILKWTTRGAVAAERILKWNVTGAPVPATRVLSWDVRFAVRPYGSASYPTLVAADSPLFWFRFDETGSPSVFNDSGPSNRDLTLGGSWTLDQPGIPGDLADKGAKPVDQSGYGSFSANPMTGLDLPLTLEFAGIFDTAKIHHILWYGIGTTGNGWGAESETHWSVNVDSAGRMVMSMFTKTTAGSGGPYNQSSAFVIPTGKLVVLHWVWDYGTNNIKFYIDGVLVHTAMFAAAVTPTWADYNAFHVGRSGNDRSRDFKGTINELALYNAAFDQTKIQARVEAIRFGQSGTSLLWNTQKAVSTERVIVWNVQAPVVLTADRSVQLVWNVRAPVGASPQIVWNTSVPVAPGGAYYTWNWEGGFVHYNAGSGTTRANSTDYAYSGTRSFKLICTTDGNGDRYAYYSTANGFPAIPPNTDVEWSMRVLSPVDTYLDYGGVYIQEAAGSFRKVALAGNVSPDLRALTAGQWYTIGGKGRTASDWDSGTRHNVRPPSVGPSTAQPYAMTALYYDDLVLRLESLTRLSWSVRQVVAKDSQLVWNVQARIAVGEETALVWAVRKAAEAERILKWNVRAAIPTTRSLVWNVSTPTPATRILKWNVSTPTPATRILKWNVSTASGKSTQVVWNVSTSTSATRILRWDTRALATTTRALVWNARALATATRVLLWNVEVIGFVAVGKSTQLVWNARASVPTTRAIVWNVSTPAAASRVLKWNVSAFIAAARVLKWNVSTSTPTTRILRWNVSTSTSATRALVWSLRKIAPAERGLLWNVLSNAAVGAVGKSTIIRWAVRAATPATRVLAWSVRTAAPSERALVWRVSIPAEVHKSLKWNVRAGVATQREAIWRVSALASRVLVLRWFLSTRAALERALRWNVSTPAYRTVTLPWSVRTDVAGSSALRWEVRATPGTSRVLRWSTRVLAARSVDARWRVREVVPGLERSLLWNLEENVALTSRIVWDMEGKVRTDIRLLWGILSTGLNIGPFGGHPVAPAFGGSPGTAGFGGGPHHDSELFSGHVLGGE
jgi:hypothetical protein